MGRWKQSDSDVTSGALVMRKWVQTETGRAYKLRHNEYAKEWRKNNKDQFKTTQKRAQQAVRLEALQHYSKDIPECACCGEKGLPFLTLDHINGDGAAHRRELGMAQGDPAQVERQNQKVTMSANGFCYWLKKNNWPEGIQVLCMNCNFAKRDNKYCPHELANGKDMQGNPISQEYYPIAIIPMPVRKGIERDAWLGSPEGLEYREKQAAAKRGKPSMKDTRVEVSCLECGTVLKRKQCEITRKTNKDGEARFFCNKKCSGVWKSKNLVGDRIYNCSPDLHLPCGFSGCTNIVVRKKHEVRPGQQVYCNKECQREAFKLKVPWNKRLVTATSE